MKIYEIIEQLEGLREAEQKTMKENQTGINRDHVQGGIDMLNVILSHLESEQKRIGEYPPEEDEYQPYEVGYSLKDGYRVELTTTRLNCREGGKRHWRLLDIDDNVIRSGITCACGYGCDETDCIEDSDMMALHNTVLEEYRMPDDDLAEPCSFGENLKWLRKKVGITQKQLAERIGVNYRSVLRWEANQNEPSITMLVKISEVLHCSLDRLMQKS